MCVLMKKVESRSLSDEVMKLGSLMFIEHPVV